MNDIQKVCAAIGAMLAAFVIFMLLLHGARAAEPSKEFNLRLTQQDVSYIAGLLQAQPFRDVVDILNRIQQQLNEQLPPPAPPKEDIPK